MRVGKGKPTKLEINSIALRDTLPRLQEASLWKWEDIWDPFFLKCPVSYIYQAWYGIGTWIKESLPIKMIPHRQEKYPSVSLNLANKLL